MRVLSSAPERRLEGYLLISTFIYKTAEERHRTTHSIDDSAAYYTCNTLSTTMKFIIVVFLAMLALVRAQFGDFGSYNFGFGGGLDAPLQNSRDPRANTGPVVFPPAPPDNGETSGVIVGASGFGFVPPNSPIGRGHFAFY